jgi:hypothetical protein
MLEVGASVAKNHAPRNPTLGLNTNARHVNTASARRKPAYGRTAPSVRGRGTP